MAVVPRSEFMGAGVPESLTLGTVRALLTMIRGYEGYTTSQHPDVEGRLLALLEPGAGLTDEQKIQARQLNCALDHIEEEGAGEGELRGGDEAVYASERTERNAYIRYALDVLYPKLKKSGSSVAFLAERVDPTGMRTSCVCGAAACCCANRGFPNNSG